MSWRAKFARIFEDKNLCPWKYEFSSNFIYQPIYWDIYEGNFLKQKYWV